MNETSHSEATLSIEDILLTLRKHLKIIKGLSISVIEAQAAGVIPIVSNGIPTVTNITGNVIFLDVKASDCHWVEIIEKVLSTTTYDKIKMNQIVDDSEFSSRSFLKSISELYEVQ